MYWRFILSISTMEVVCTRNADNKSRIYFRGQNLSRNNWLRQETCSAPRVASRKLKVSRLITQPSLVPLVVLQTDNSFRTKTILFQNVGSLHLRLHLHIYIDDVRSDYNILKPDVNIFVESKLCFSERDDAYQLRKFTSYRNYFSQSNRRTCYGLYGTAV